MKTDSVEEMKNQSVDTSLDVGYEGKLEIC